MDEKVWGLHTATEEAKQKTTGSGMRMESSLQSFSCGYMATAFLMGTNSGRMQYYYNKVSSILYGSIIFIELM